MARLQSVSLLFVAAVVMSSAGCQSMNYGDRGALFGGLTGAAAGAAIGDANGNALPGAVIGSAVGAFTGAVVGDGIDRDVARNRAEVEARVGRQMAGAVTAADVIAMSQAGLSDDVISTHIRAHGVAQPPQVNDLIYLRNQGVTDNVIRALQSAPGPQTATASYAPPPRAVIVEERVYAPYCAPPPPFWYYHHPHHHHGHAHHGRGNFHWGVSFRN